MLYYLYAFLLAFLVELPLGAQNVNSYFKKIRNHQAFLTVFFSQMPKGGDLHHHFSGSIYAETYLAYAIEKDYWINVVTLEVTPEKKSEEGWLPFSSLKAQGLLETYKQKLIQKWSIKDYNGIDIPSDKLFFETFIHFGPISKKCWAQGLLELKNRAIAENVSYIETMLSTIPCTPAPAFLENYSRPLRLLQQKQDSAGLFRLLDSLLPALEPQTLAQCAAQYAQQNRRLHDSLQLDDERFIIRYQTYALRHAEPLLLFRNLWIAFEAAAQSPLIVGVNIVGAEDHSIALQDYWLHMAMFRYCHKKFPSVKYAMHAGELTLGLVKPEDLSWHIKAALEIAGANRIGHGVDIAYETAPYQILQNMRLKKIPIEINLSSNEFILKVKEDKHPLELYRKAKVPIVICTDDAGVLRSNLTQQFVLLAQRYKNITYKQIKSFVFNSLQYAFLEEPDLKQKLLVDLKNRFAAFEKKYLKKIKGSIPL
jgi:hypothetical protein